VTSNFLGGSGMAEVQREMAKKLGRSPLVVMAHETSYVFNAGDGE
jgi:hypothetical protein